MPTGWRRPTRRSTSTPACCSSTAATASSRPRALPPASTCACTSSAWTTAPRWPTSWRAGWSSPRSATEAKPSSWTPRCRPRPPTTSSVASSTGRPGPSMSRCPSRPPPGGRCPPPAPSPAASGRSPVRRRCSGSSASGCSTPSACSRPPTCRSSWSPGAAASAPRRRSGSTSVGWWEPHRPPTGARSASTRPLPNPHHGSPTARGDRRGGAATGGGGAAPAGGPPPLPFDHLVLAVGATTSWFGIPGAAEHSLPLYTLQDATRLRNHVIARFEAADADPALVDDGELTFVVVGGGPTGVETAGALAELFSVVFRRDYPDLAVGRARVVLVEARDSVLAPFHPSSQRAAVDTLRARQVEVRLDETVAEVTGDHVRFASGEVLPTRTVVWAAGVRANPLAAAREGDGDRPLPQLAPVAMQSGAHVAGNVGRVLAGRPTTPFRFRDKGTMATIGRRAAVAELPGRIRLRG